MVTAYEAWQADEADFRINADSELDDFLRVMESVIDNGVIPNQCLTLVIEARKLLVAYDGYQNGEWKPGTLEPTEKFYLAVAAVVAARVVAEPPQRAMLETVATLRKQGVSDRQISHIYGTRNPQTGEWSGPFLRNGVPVENLITSEAEHPGSVIGDDWVHPDETAKQDRFATSMKDRLHRIDNRAAAAQAQTVRKTARPSDDDIADYLREGGFPAQAFKMWRSSGVTLEDVYDVAKRHDIVMASKDDPTAPIDRLSPEDAALMEPPAIQQGHVDTVTFNEDAFQARVLELSARGDKPAEIRQTIQQETGKQFSPQKIAAVIREAKDSPEPVAAG